MARPLTAVSGDAESSQHTRPLASSFTGSLRNCGVDQRSRRYWRCGRHVKPVPKQKRSPVQNSASWAIMNIVTPQIEWRKFICSRIASQAAERPGSGATVRPTVSKPPNWTARSWQHGRAGTSRESRRTASNAVSGEKGNRTQSVRGFPRVAYKTIAPPSRGTLSKRESRGTQSVTKSNVHKKQKRHW